MQQNNSLIRFIKDGFIGLIIIVLEFCVVLGTLLILVPEFSAKELEILFEQLFIFPKTSLSIVNGQENWHVFFSPMPLIILITFLVVGSSGKSFENITSRISWIKPIIIIVLKSWLAGVILWPVILVVIVQIWIGSNDSLRFSINLPSLFGTIGAIIGLLIGCLAGFFLNPNKRRNRIIIGAVASTCVSYVLGAGILLQQWVQ